MQLSSLVPRPRSLSLVSIQFQVDKDSLTYEVYEANSRGIRYEEHFGNNIRHFITCSFVVRKYLIVLASPVLK